MPLNRRQFFGSFWGPEVRRGAERKARCDSLEGYAWTNLVPYDFSLTEDQSRQLGVAVRSLLTEASDEELFSSAMPGRLEKLVLDLVEPWRPQY